jgi:plastocyanin
MITIKDFNYHVSGPVSPGEKVVVKNNDNVNHTVTSDSGAGKLFNVNVPSGGGTKTFTAPSKPGTYPFHCNYHAHMHGKLVVK